MRIRDIQIIHLLFKTGFYCLRLMNTCIQHRYLLFQIRCINSRSNFILNNQYVQPIISSTISYQIFSPVLPWQKEILDILQEIFTQQNSAYAKELITSSLLQKLLAVFFEHIDTTHLNQQQDHSAQSQIKLQVMMQYIHTNYSSQIALSDIAQSAGISKSSALSFFHKYLKMAPVSYLILYRLKKASELLITTDLKLVEIAYATGFNNIGYFCKQYKIHYGITPTEYRKLKAQRK